MSNTINKNETNKNEAKNSFGDFLHMIKLGLVLAAFAVAACLCLALVNNVTFPVIQKNAAEKTRLAMKSIFPEDGLDFVAIKDFEKSKNVDISEMYLVLQDGQTVGVATRASGATYERTTLLVGQDLEMKITGVEILETTDSPGFGKNMMEKNYTVKSGQTFAGQFAGKDATAGFTVGENFDGISGATISSKGVADILTEATKVAAKYLQNLNGENNENNASLQTDEEAKDVK